MKRNRSTMTQAVLRPLRTAWEDTVAAGLRKATDVELLWMLDEIEAQLGERQVPWEVARGSSEELPDEIPDWDDKTPEELEAIIQELEAETAADAHEMGSVVCRGEPIGHLPTKPHSWRSTRATEKQVARLRCEELEPRYPPTTFLVVVLQPAPAVAVISTWNARETASSNYGLPWSTAAADSSALVWNGDAAGDLAQALVA